MFTLGSHFQAITRPEEHIPNGAMEKNYAKNLGLSVLPTPALGHSINLQVSPRVSATARAAGDRAWLRAWEAGEAADIFSLAKTWPTKMSLLNTQRTNLTHHSIISGENSIFQKASSDWDKVL